MSKDKIETKKKSTNVWKGLGKAALAVGSVVVIFLKKK